MTHRVITLRFLPYHRYGLYVIRMGYDADGNLWYETIPEPFHETPERSARHTAYARRRRHRNRRRA